MDIVNETYKRFGITIKQTAHDAWQGACPFCREGEDRFVVWAEGNYWCRKCLSTGWLRERDSNWKPDPYAYRRALERIEQQKKEQAARLASWQQHLSLDTVARWHDEMDEAHRKYWIEEAGVTEENVDRYLLGYCPHKRVKINGQIMDMTAHTIPINDPVTRQLVNVQYRLEHPPSPRDRYRQEFGIPRAVFYATVDLDGDVIIVEGAKKAIGVSQLTQGKIQVLGLPGISADPNMIEKLRPYRRKWLIPDPDATSAQVQTYYEQLPNLYVVTLPIKPDDAINKGWLNRRNFTRYLEIARR